MPTIFRSKKSQLVEQELYGMLIAYNLLRDLMYQAANKYGKDPLLLSFLESLQLVTENWKNNHACNLNNNSF
ncbi:hypothetical protein B4U84_25790 [Westiellopsis prolifica IICB1]|nr:hypothetical protein B4U84_25790 [Westiellopsis prolifica IICB1]